MVMNVKLEIEFEINSIDFQSRLMFDSDLMFYFIFLHESLEATRFKSAVAKEFY